MIYEEEGSAKVSPNSTGRARDPYLTSLRPGKGSALPNDCDQPLQKKHRGTVEAHVDANAAPSNEHHDAVTREQQTKPRASFKAIGHLVLAMKRFQGTVYCKYDAHR